MTKQSKTEVHHAMTVTPRQAVRMRLGHLESKPEDYRRSVTPEGRTLLDAIHGNEDRRMVKSLSEWW